MKILIALILFGSVAVADDLSNVRSCLSQLRTPMHYRDRVALTSKCFALANPLKYSSEISGRSLYVIALSQFLTSETATFAKLNALLNNSFDETLGGLPTASMSNEELSDVYQAAQLAYFYSPFLSDAKVGLKVERRLFEELERRGLATNQQASDLIAVLERDSEWSDARSLSLRYRDDGEVPPVSGFVKGPAYLVDHGTSFSSVPMAFKGAQFVMSGSCHFAISAIAELAKHPDLAQLWVNHGLALADPELRDLSEIRNLKTKYPAFEMHPVVNAGAWSKASFNMMSSPSFVFLKDGHIVYSFDGFLGPETVTRFCEGIKRTGLTADSCP